MSYICECVIHSVNIENISFPLISDQFVTIHEGYTMKVRHL